MFKAMLRIGDYSGRSTRWEYWSFTIGLALVTMLTGVWVAGYRNTHYGLDPQFDEQQVGWISIAVLALIIAPNLALRVRRYHDFGWSGWAVLWTAVPVVNLVMELMLLFRGPVQSTPAYADPEPRQINIYNTPSAGAVGDPVRSGLDHVDQIARLADLHSRGQLTRDEFTAAKAKLLRP